MSVINTNISAMKATNASSSANKALGTAMERLSTGKRINSAKDDAAGLAITTSMTSQIRGMNQGIRNGNDGISLAQTAEGALNEVTNMLQRVRELAVQASSGTYQDDDRTAMQAEVSALTSQISDVLNNSKFNGNNLFNVTDAAPNADGDDDVKTTIQVGAQKGETIELVSKAFDGTKIFGGTNTVYDPEETAQALDVSDATKAGTTIENVDATLKNVASTRASLGAGQSRLESAVNNLTNNVTNMSDARSRIEDTDYSAETTALAKAQILSQASTAMLSQANQSAQGVLSLLR